jgi:sugar (pentulose or hexulose) kinase
LRNKSPKSIVITNNEKGKPMEQNVWKSAISTEMVEGWSENDVETLINALDDAVMQVFQSVEEERA